MENIANLEEILSSHIDMEERIIITTRVGEYTLSVCSGIPTFYSRNGSNMEIGFTDNAIFINNIISVEDVDNMELYTISIKTKNNVEYLICP